MVFKRGSLALVLVLATAATFCQAATSDFILWNGTLPGRLYVPSGYTPGQSYPFILFFDGLGAGGNDNLKQITSGTIDNLLAECKQRQCFLYAPQSPIGWWYDDQVNAVVPKIFDAIAAYNIDTSRIYVTGVSAGGGGTFNVMETHPDLFAAAVPISAACGGDQARDNVLVGKPMWLYHAANDAVIGVDQSRGALNGIRAQDGNKPAVVFPLDVDPANPYYNTGAPHYTDGTTYYNEHNLHYTEYDIGDHYIWARVYSEEWMFNWLFSQTLDPSANTPPSVNAGDDATMTLPSNTLALDAAVSDDNRPDPPGAVTVAWTQQSGPAGVTFADATAVDTTATFPAVAGIYVLRLTADDGLLHPYDELTVTIRPVPPPGEERVIQPLGVNTATGSSYCSGYMAFDAPPVWDSLAGRPVGDDPSPYGGTDAGYAGRFWYIDFGPDYANLRITATWTRYVPYSSGNHGGYAALWWDDDTDIVNDNGVAETRINFVKGQGLANLPTQLWARDSDLRAAPAVPPRRYLLLSVGPVDVGRANELAIIGYIAPPAPEILPGDFNGDGSVTHGDYTVWADHFGRSIAEVQAEHPGWFPAGSYLDGAASVTHGLYTTWADHFGDTIGASLTVGQETSAAVAEAAGDAGQGAARAITPATARSAAALKRAQRLQQRQQRRAERAERRGRLPG